MLKSILHCVPQALHLSGEGEPFSYLHEGACGRMEALAMKVNLVEFTV